MQLEPILLCHDVDRVGSEWSLIRVTRRFPASTGSFFLTASISGGAPGTFVAVNVDVFAFSVAGGESILPEPIRLELEFKSTWPELLVVRIAPAIPLQAGSYFASLDFGGVSSVVPFEVEAESET